MHYITILTAGKDKKREGIKDMQLVAILCSVYVEIGISFGKSNLNGGQNEMS